MMRRVTEELKAIKVTGCLVPFYSNGQPVLIEFSDSPDKFVFVFSTKEKLEEAMKGINYDSIKEINDGPGFVESVVAHARIAVDPWKTEVGTTRWSEIVDFTPTSSPN